MEAVAGAVVLTLTVQYALSNWTGVSGLELDSGSKEEDVEEMNLHAIRRVQHALTGCIFVYLSISGTLSARALTLTLAVCAACFYSVHLLRLQFPGLNAFLVKHYKNILRPDEARGKLPGAFYFLLGTALSCAVFDTHIFHLAILFLSFGDPAAGLFGTLLKRGNPGNSKSFGGSFAAFVASALSTLVLELICCHGSEINHDLTLAKVSLLGGIIGALAERVNLLGIDDNFTLPLCAGLAMTLLNQRVATFGICISLRS